jgi:excisionase family DNA binding protein
MVSARQTEIAMQNELEQTAGNSVEFLNKDGVAAMLNISRRSVDSMLARGELPHIRLSKRCIRFPRQAVLDALSARTICIR